MEFRKELVSSGAGVGEVPLKFIFFFLRRASHLLVEAGAIAAFVLLGVTQDAAPPTILLPMSTTGMGDRNIIPSIAARPFCNIIGSQLLISFDSACAPKIPSYNTRSTVRKARGLKTKSTDEAYRLLMQPFVLAYKSTVC